MRVISQDGTMDVPYEQVIIQRFKSRIYFLNKNLTGVEPLTDDMQIAEYSTEEKAKKAMEELQYAYACHNMVLLNKEKANDIPNDKMMKAVIGGVFQFPTEEELE